MLYGLSRVRIPCQLKRWFVVKYRSPRADVVIRRPYVGARIGTASGKRAQAS